MKCTYCGHENSDSINFCENCGAKLEKPEAPKPQAQTPAPTQNQAPAPAAAAVGTAGAALSKAKSGISKVPKKYLYIGAGVIALILIIILCVNLFKPAKYPAIKLNLTQITDADGQMQLYNGVKKLGAALDDVTVSGSYRYGGKNADIAAFLSAEGNLYLATEKGVTSVAESVAHFVISSDGTAIVYLTTDDTLQLYTIKSKSTEQISDEVTSADFAVSPNGKTVLYTLSNDNDESSMYIYASKKSNEVAKGLTPIGLNNNGSLIYAYSAENKSLYVTNKGGDKTKLAADVSSFYLMNNDHTQIIFATTDGKIYISTKGADKVKLFNGTSAYMLQPKNSVALRDAVSSNLVITYPLSNLLGNTYTVYGEDTVLYFAKTKAGETNKIASNVSSVYLTSNGKTVVYRRNQDAYKKAVTSEDTATKLAEDVTTILPTPDGSAIYYINEDDELMYVKGTGKAKKIADDASNMIMASDGTLLFLTDYAANDGVLYSSKNGSAKKKIADSVYSLYSSGDGVYYKTEYDAEDKTVTVYGASGNAKFSKLAENAVA